MEYYSVTELLQVNIDMERFMKFSAKKQVTKQSYVQQDPICITGSNICYQNCI